MKAHPMPFSAPMILALLESRKTQTRRLLQSGENEHGRSTWPCYQDGKRVTPMCHPPRIAEGPNNSLLSPAPIKPGDLIWVREHWKSDRHYDDLAPSDMGGEEPLIYNADSEVQRWGWRPDALSRWGRFRQGMHMPRWANRITLEVKDVRVQRLQAISDQDALAEGVEFAVAPVAGQDIDIDGEFWPGGPKRMFSQLWDSLNSKRAPWADNPWVVAYSFKVHKQNVDEFTAQLVA
jgi:hypothetical protein